MKISKRQRSIACDYSEEYSVDSNIYTFFSRIVCGRRVRVEHAVPYDEHRKDKSSKRRKPNYR
jgi:hypothetical protein